MQPVIKAENISKRYRIGGPEEKYDTFAGQMVGMLKAPFRNFGNLRKLNKFNGEDETVFWALKDINFEVQQGEVLGIIGHNGAGKSTLLKILSRITEPTTGSITIRGRVSSLLEVGTGFHPDLSGRDNIYMNGTLLGMTKREIDSKLDEIIEFSGITKHIDTPVKRYSSGMTVRLAFSVAAHLEPEILIIDEVLAVGDAEFQKKCLGKMKEVSSDGRTVLFVSHNMAAVQSMCTNLILLKKGNIYFQGDPREGIAKYFQKANTASEIGGIYRQKGLDYTLLSSEIRVNGEPSVTPMTGDLVDFLLTFKRLTKNTESLSISLLLFRDGELVTNLWTDYTAPFQLAEADIISIRCRVPFWNFRNGAVSVDMYSHSRAEVQDWIEGIFELETTERNIFSTNGVLNTVSTGQVFMDHEWNNMYETQKSY